MPSDAFDEARRWFAAAVSRRDRSAAEAALADQRRLAAELGAEVVALTAEADEMEGRRLADETEVWLAAREWRWE